MVLLGVLVGLAACAEDAKVKNVTFTYSDWTALPVTANIPTLRFGPQYGVSGNKIIIMGGYAPYPTGTGVVEVFNTTAETWATSAATLPIMTSGAISGVLNEKMYLSAGYTPSNGYILNTQEYDVANESFTDCASSTTGSPCANVSAGNFGAGAELAASVVHNGKIYSFGGKRDLSGFDDVVREYDIATNTWTNCAGGCAPVPAGPTWMGTAEVVNGKAYYFDPWNGLLEYDIAANAWTNCGTPAPGNNCPAVPFAITGLTATVQIQGRIFALHEGTTTLYEYTPATNTWTNCGTPDPGNGCPVLPGTATHIEAVDSRLYAFDQATGTIYKATFK
ncbi:MAG: hypothetical protein OEZ59_05715 [Deltaproteobacteria bacterium]|nr:hypothetical protein [Deltaproteobacteria bacterium]